MCERGRGSYLIGEPRERCMESMRCGLYAAETFTFSLIKREQNDMYVRCICMCEWDVCDVVGYSVTLGIYTREFVIRMRGGGGW